MNLILLIVMLVVASPKISFASFGGDMLTNIGNFSQFVVNLFDEFRKGAYHA